jgi:hypothetical protein
VSAPLRNTIVSAPAGAPALADITRASSAEVANIDRASFVVAPRCAGLFSNSNPGCIFGLHLFKGAVSLAQGASGQKVRQPGCYR